MSNPDQRAKKLIETARAYGYSGPFEDVLLCLAEKALQRDAAIRQRSAKGALGQMAAASERQARYTETARLLISERSNPFPSYRCLARAVANKVGTPRAEEAIRKHLSEEGVLSCKNSG